MGATDCPATARGIGECAIPVMGVAHGDDWSMAQKFSLATGTGAEELARQMRSYGGLEMLEHGLD